jgi:signal transduction histidine kinase
VIALPALAHHLADKQNSILRDWRERVDSVMQSSMLAKLSHAEFYDDIPEFLDRLCMVLRGEAEAGTGRFARYHGAQRWQHGMSLEAVTAEWGLLHEVLMDHVAAASREDVDFDPSSLYAAYRMLGGQIQHGIAASLAEYDKRRRVDAEARMRDLEAAYAQHDEQDKQRGRNLHEASHDLRGSLQVVQLLCDLLKTRLQGTANSDVIERLCVATGNVNQLVRDLLDLARLEAGREDRHVEDFDAAAMLNELCDTMRPMAECRGLTLTTRGEAHLPVRGDILKIKRIAQNLVLNALKYTQAGSVEIGWHRHGSGERWLFYVRDSGPGLPSSSAAEKLARNLKDAAVPGDAATDTGPHLRSLPPLTAESGGASDGGSNMVERHGEGIGLSIVRQLCELLDGVVEVESEPGRGTMFRILLPADYPRTYQAE